MKIILGATIVLHDISASDWGASPQASQIKRLSISNQLARVRELRDVFAPCKTPPFSCIINMRMRCNVKAQLVIITSQTVGQ